MTGDWKNINDRVYRAMINEYRREIEMAQDHLAIHQHVAIVLELEPQDADVAHVGHADIQITEVIDGRQCEGDITALSHDGLGQLAHQSSVNRTRIRVDLDLAVLRRGEDDLEDVQRPLYAG